MATEPLNFLDGSEVCSFKTRKKIKDYPQVETPVNSAPWHINVTMKHNAMGQNHFMIFHILIKASIYQNLNIIRSPRYSAEPTLLKLFL